MTISEFLKGSFDFTFSDANILTVLTRRGLTADTPLESVDEKSIDLVQADLYMILANAVSGGGRRVQKGNRSVSERTYQFGVYDRRAFREMANHLYAKWGESASVSSSARFVHLRGD
jgi:hypothetical protein